MTPQQFVAKWKKADLSERSAYQQHFLDLCELLGQPKPADVDPTGKWYTFEKGVDKTDGGKGFADAWLQDKFVPTSTSCFRPESTEADRIGCVAGLSLAVLMPVCCSARDSRPVTCSPAACRVRRPIEPSPRRH
jgi:hypothetical protein